MARYSQSKLSTFQQCPLKYRFGYIDGIKKEEEGIEAFTGTLVHTTLEVLLERKREFGTEPDYPKAEEIFQKLWEENYHPGVLVVNEYAEPDDYRRRGLMCLKNFFQMDSTEDYGELVSLEINLFFKLGERSISGKIDRVQREGTTYHIIDYKTSKGDMTQEAADEDRQLALYELGIRDKYPDTEKVILHWYMLGHNNIVSSTRNESELAALKASVLALIDEIENTSDFLPKESSLCGWCEYKEECEAEKEKRTLKATEVEPEIEDVVEEYTSLIEQQGRLNKEINTVKAELDQRKARLIEVCVGTGAWSIEGREHALDVKKKTEYSIPKKGSETRDALDTLVREVGLWDEVTDLNKTAVVDAFEKRRFGSKTADAGSLLEEKEKFNFKVRDKA